MSIGLWLTTHQSAQCSADRKPLLFMSRALNAGERSLRL